MLTLTSPVALFWNAIFGSSRSTQRAFGGFRRNESQTHPIPNSTELPSPIEELLKIRQSPSELRDVFLAAVAGPVQTRPLAEVALEDKLVSSTEILAGDKEIAFADIFEGLMKNLSFTDFAVTPVSRRKGIWKCNVLGTNFSFLASTASGNSNVIYIQRRGFRTRVAIGVGQEKLNVSRNLNPTEGRQGVGNIFSFLNRSDSDRAAQAPLSKLLSDAKTDASRKGLKDAFAEGYQTGVERSVKKKNAFWLFFARASFVVVLLYIFWPLIAEVFGTAGRSTLFKTMHTEVNPEDVKVTFNDVKAIDEAKAEVKQIVEYLKDPERFCRLGARLPKGVLLVGPPGTGKTLLARAIAGEAGVPFFRAAGSEFEEMLVGQGARRVRELFGAARQRAPCVVFIDEIDSCGSRRTSSAIHPYANQMINQLLTEMDGFEPNEGVIVLAATNRREDLDPALMRPGRFDVEIHVGNPDLKGRQDIFRLYLSKVVAGKDVDIDVLARRTVGFSGADIESMVNQAALKAAADNKDEVNMDYLEAARHFVISGPAKSRIPDEQTNQLTAYHEAGHALVAYFTPDAIPLDRATIIPRGGSLGHTSFIPEKEQYHQTKAELLAALDSAMGGRAAEELIYGTLKVTTGAGSDLKKATEIASLMVKQAGMSEKVGLRNFEGRRNELGMNTDELSPSTTEAIDNEIKRLLQESYERARAILKAHSAAHKRLAEALLQSETLEFKEIKAIIDGESMVKS